MILSNYWKWKDAINNLSYIATGSGSSSISVNTQMKNTSNVSARMASGYFAYEAVSDLKQGIVELKGIVDNTMPHKNIELQLSSSDATLDVNTYTLPNQVDYLQKLTLATNYSGQNGEGKVTIAYSGRNTGSSNMVIKRAGIVKKIIYYSTANDSANPQYESVLMGFVDLDQTLVVPAGEGFTINIEWAEA